MREKKILKRLLAVFATTICIAGISADTVYADTDGTELQVVQPSQLEIQLGPEWSGIEFQLRTDAGVYPGVIAVDDTGILSLEIGGSTSYVLSCLNSTVAVPSPEDEQQAPAITERTTSENSSSKDSSEELQSAENAEANVDRIPIENILLFGGGLVLAVGCLIALHVVKKGNSRDNRQTECDENDEFPD